LVGLKFNAHTQFTTLSGLKFNPTNTFYVQLLRQLPERLQLRHENTARGNPFLVIGEKSGIPERLMGIVVVWNTFAQE